MEEVVPAKRGGVRRCGVQMQMQVAANLPENARDVLASGEQEAADVLVGLPVYRSRNEKVLDCGAGGVSAVDARRRGRGESLVGTHTVVDLLQGNDRVWGKALLGVLIE